MPTKKLAIMLIGVLLNAPKKYYNANRDVIGAHKKARYNANWDAKRARAKQSYAGQYRK